MNESFVLLSNVLWLVLQQFLYIIEIIALRDIMDLSTLEIYLQNIFPFAFILSIISDYHVAQFLLNCLFPEYEIAWPDRYTIYTFIGLVLLRLNVLFAWRVIVTPAGKIKLADETTTNDMARSRADLELGLSAQILPSYSEQRRDQMNPPPEYTLHPEIVPPNASRL